jgi:DMSO/TMAO reductase YedYZ heme-binding membrane subunit
MARAKGRHRRTPVREHTPPAGPVTLAIRIARAQPARVPALLLRAWPAVPALFLIAPAMASSPRFADYAGQILGLDATLALTACLIITPVLTAVRLPITALRWWYGIWVFVLGWAGLVITVAMPGPGGLATKAAGSAVNWTGLIIVALLLPMAATSTAAAQKMLGGEWKRWQRQLIWTVWALVLIHLAVLHATVTGIGFAMATLPLVLLRVRPVRRAVRSWRAAGYTSRGMWTTLYVCCTVTAVGIALLSLREGEAVARAIALA